MRIAIATDSFKGTLRALEACRIIAEAIAERIPDAELVIKPMADGGEGTAEAMMAARGGRWLPRTVMGPLPGMQVEAGSAWFDTDKTALVEMASASGLELLSPGQMNPLYTTTYGTSYKGSIVRVFCVMPLTTHEITAKTSTPASSVTTRVMGRDHPSPTRLKEDTRRLVP